MAQLSLSLSKRQEQKKIAYPSLVFFARGLLVVAAQWGQFIRSYSSFTLLGRGSIPEMELLSQDEV